MTTPQAPVFLHVDRVLADFAKKDKPSSADFAAVQALGSFYDKLDTYRIEANKMGNPALKTELHKSSRLAEHMTLAGDSRPSARCDCHAIISGGHKKAIAVRAIMAWLKVRIDDPHNGCWLPRDWADRPYMPRHLQSAVPHKRIHFEEYYNWLGSRINLVTINSANDLIFTLNFIRRSLSQGAVPPEVMPITGRK
ncbi:MAG: AHH domain-containing protein [Pseudomonadota bacterium]